MQEGHYRLRKTSGGRKSPPSNKFFCEGCTLRFHPSRVRAPKRIKSPSSAKTTSSMVKAIVQSQNRKPRRTGNCVVVCHHKREIFLFPDADFMQSFSENPSVLAAGIAQHSRNSSELRSVGMVFHLASNVKSTHKQTMIKNPPFASQFRRQTPQPEPKTIRSQPSLSPPS